MADNAADVTALLAQGLALHRQGRAVEAEKIYRLILQLQPKHFDGLHLLGLLALQTQRAELGVGLIGKALAIDPAFAPAHDNLGNGLRNLRRFDEALASYDKAIALRPDYADAYYNRGVVLQDMRRPEEALASYDKAVALQPGFAEAYSSRGTALAELKRVAAAVMDYDKAIALNPDLAEAYNNRGNALVELKRPAEALASYDKALALQPGFAEAWGNRGNTLRDLQRFAEALASYDKAVALQPGLAAVYLRRGDVLQGLRRLEEALASYDKALTLQPDLAEVEGQRLYTKMQLCDWRNLAAESAHLLATVRQGKVITSPFVLLAIQSTSEDQLRCAELWAARSYPTGEAPLWQRERYDHARLRIAYLSADYCAHATAYLIAGLIALHDRSRFEIIGISYGEDDRSELRRSLAASFDRFHDIRGKSDQEAASLLYDLQIDIAIDLKGYTRDSRLGIFAYRPAPVQVTYLGYPGTLGAPFIDYVIADKLVLPIEQRNFYTEKIVYLPDCYQVNDRRRKLAEASPSRVAAGLPAQGIVFCCFNVAWKITPPIFDIWMRLLKRVAGSVLWLLEDNATAAENLRKEAALRGVGSERLIFAKRLPLPDHLARHRAADLFLDTLPYNAHTTANDALWTGLPVLTCLGDTFSGRVAASLLAAVDLPELIATSLAEYEEKAFELATNSDKLAHLKRKLADHRGTAALFDTESFARNIEAAYTAIAARQKAGLPPDHLVIARA